MVLQGTTVRAVSQKGPINQNESKKNSSGGHQRTDEDGKKCRSFLNELRLKLQPLQETFGHKRIYGEFMEEDLAEQKDHPEIVQGDMTI